MSTNVELLRAMFAFDDAQPQSGGRWPQPGSPAFLTASLVRQQQAVHERLSSTAARYAAPDTRRVRVDVDELDALYDIHEEACATHLFDLQPAPFTTAHKADESKEAAEAEDEKDDASVSSPASTDDDTKEQSESDKEVIAPRRLLLTALAQRATTAELRLLHSLLCPSLQRAWKGIASLPQ